ncbi:EF-hand domain-containing protein [Paucibacter sp. TC2R-5]|uniref:EF-hand domain-containing protein n=1 Tax=Paucibacter sp. TC2R-5 TaxID=2893555 RepID=UPI0021E4B631|nr:EF-hand domain-containing protein [Paucibacter sp. TC2R-5]MCV2358576.1 EF-hand domain-containing protein [Paucibacter sp. TC2R-5]
MNASISSIAVSANARAAAPPRLPPKAEDVFKQIDSEGKGSVTASDAAAYLVKISPEGARKADAADSSSTSQLQQDIERALSKADADGNGQLNQAEFKQALAQGPAGSRRAGADADGDGDKGAGAAAGRSQGAGRHHGPPPGGAGGAGAGAKAGGASSASTNYEKEDANRDGKVTEPERQAYAVQHPKQAAAEAAQSVKTATAASAVRAASDLALQRYQEVASSVE